MAGFWDKVKKGAQDAGEKAAQLAKIAKIQTEITGLGSSRKEKVLSLGEKLYGLYKEGKLGEAVQDELKETIASLESVERKINDKKDEIEKIKAEANEKKEKTKAEAKEKVEEAKAKVNETAKTAENKVNEATEKTKEKVKEQVEKVKETAKKIKEKATDTTEPKKEADEEK